MKDDIISGNVEKIRTDSHWFFGHFMDEIPEFKSSDFELKWGKHKAGDKKAGIGSNTKARTLTILIRGKIRITFPDNKKECLLEKEGDFAYWESGIKHSWEALEDSVALTVRWPSLPGDQKSILGDLNRSQGL